MVRPAKVSELHPPGGALQSQIQKESKLLRVTQMVAKILGLINHELKRHASASEGDTSILEFKLNHMPKQTRAELLRDYARLKKRKTTHFVTLAHNLETPAESHTSIAIFEAWADGLVSDEYVNALMAKHDDCGICKDNYEFYRKLKEKHAERPEP